MFIVDALRPVENGQVMLPPYHGHLGFMDPLELHVSLVKPRREDIPRRCELICTAYEPASHRSSDFVDLSCVMNEKKGVVASLLDAIGSTNANILLQESSVANHLDHHVVHLTLDLSTMGRSIPISSEDGVRFLKYRELQRLLPVTDERYVTLVTTIIAKCGEDLYWPSEPKPSLPLIRLSPLQEGMSDESYADIEHATVIRLDTESASRVRRVGYNAIQFQPSTIDHIRGLLGVPSTEQLKCLLLSEPSARRLRVVFPRPDISARLVHVGFAHVNRPRALAAISAALSNAGFNLFTSLLRKARPGENLWEVWLENQREEDVVPKRDDLQEQTKAQFEWVFSRISEVAASQYASVLGKYRVRMVLPAYPRSKVSLPDNEFRFPERQDALKEQPRPTALDNVQAQIRNADLGYSAFVEHIPGLRLIEEMLSKRDARTVFISLPRSLAAEGEKFRRRLEDIGYSVDIYLAPDGRPIIKTVIEKIQRCDFFAGIWQCDSRQTSKNVLEPYTSPWLPFELGVARSLGKPWHYVGSSRLEESVIRSLADDRSIQKFDLETPTGKRNAIDALIEAIKSGLPIKGGRLQTKRGSSRATKKRRRPPRHR